jgi:hypothetical protein
MLAKALVATESQMGRSGTDTTVTRSSLIRELEARRVRITERRRLMLALFKSPLATWTRPRCWRGPGSKIRRSVASSFDVKKSPRQNLFREGSRGLKIDDPMG